MSSSSSSPFAIFRKHQKKMMVAVTLMAMFSFLFLDPSTLGSGRLTTLLFVVLIGALVGAGMWFIGSPRGKATEYGLGGLIVGAVAAFIALQSVGRATPVVATNFHNYSEMDIQVRLKRRQVANTFMALINPAYERGGFFGNASPEDIIEGDLFLREARDLGVVVDDAAVTRFIKQVTDNKLSNAQFKATLRQLGAKEGDLFDALKTELTIATARNMLRPPAGARNTAVLQTPDQLWRYFTQMNVKQRVELAAVPAAAFVPLVPEPNDSELSSFFSLHRTNYPTPDGQPGFRQPPRVKLAYLMADFEKFEQAVGRPTEEQLRAHYEANKERYRVRSIPDDPFGTVDRPASALQPDTPEADTSAPATPAETPASTTPPASGNTEPKSAAPATPEAPKPEAPATGDAPAESGEAIPAADPNSCQETPAAQEPAVTDSPAPAADAPKPEAAASDAPKSEAPAADAPKPADTATPAPTTTAGSETPAADAKPVEPLVIPPAPTDAPGLPAVTPAEPTYQTFEEARSKVEEDWLRERAKERMREVIAKATEEMSDLSDSYYDVTDEKLRKVRGEELSAELKKLASKYRLDYYETRLLSQQELRATTGKHIGTAIESVGGGANMMGQRNGAPVADAAFASTALFRVRPAENAFGNLMYVYWRTQEEKDRVPELSDPGVRQQVVDAWKLQQGRTMAEKRAAELLKLVQEKKQPLAEALGGQTVTGKPDGAAVTVREPAPFSFLTVSRTASPFGFGQPGPSQVDGVDQPGMDFMKVVFDDLDVGQTGVATNFPRTSYYLVRVLSRDGTGEDGEVELARLREKFSREIFTYGMPQFPTPYDILSQATVGPLYQDWMEQLRTKYEVVPQEQLLDASAVGQDEE